MTPKAFLSSALRRTAPASWQYLKYRRYLRDGRAEPEIHVIDRFVSPRLAAIDVGVYLGFYTRRLAELSAQVFAFEPNPDAARFAGRVFGPRARIEQVALSDRDGEAVLRMPAAGFDGAEPALATIATGNDLGGAAIRSLTVATRRLDSYALPTVGFVKIDVEGHEEAVLGGAAGLLDRDRPSLMIEIEERHNPGGLERVRAMFSARGYAGQFLYDGALTELDRYDPAIHQVQGSTPYVNNFFFSPR